MRRRKLAETGLQVSPLCLGTYTLAGAWGTDVAAGVAAVRAAFDTGVNFFDTARAYGRAESLLSDALADIIAAHRDEVVLCGKGGFELQTRKDAPTPFLPNSNPAFLRACLVESLRRLKTDYLDIFLIHWYDPHVPIGDAAGAMGEFVAEGLVKHVGVSNYTVGQIDEFRAVTPVEVVQLPYSLFSRQTQESLIPHCAKEGIAVMGYAALAQGFLTGTFPSEPDFSSNDFRSFTADFQGERYRSRMRAAARLEQFAKSRAATLPQLALAWVLAQPAGVVPLVGAQIPDHVHSSVQALELSLSQDDLVEISAIAATAYEMDFASLVTS